MDATKLCRQVPNLHWINFNRSPDDRIIYNGRSYAGNDTIWLDTADLAQPNATFRYYNAAYLTAISVMRALWCTRKGQRLSQCPQPVQFFAVRESCR